MLLGGLSAFGLPFSSYWHLIAFSVAYGLSDGAFIATSSYIMLSCVDGKRITASYCINNMLSSFAAAAGGPIAGELVFFKYSSTITSEYWHDVYSKNGFNI